MRPSVPVVLALLLALAGSVLSVWAGPNLAVSVPAGGLAAVGAATAGLVLLAGRLHWPVGRGPGRVDDAYAMLYQSFRTGLFGRERILSAVKELERTSGTGPRAGRTLEEEEAILHMEPDLFLRWVERCLDRIEEAT